MSGTTATIAEHINVNPSEDNKKQKGVVTSVNGDVKAMQAVIDEKLREITVLQAQLADASAETNRAHENNVRINAALNDMQARATSLLAENGALSADIKVRLAELGVQADQHSTAMQELALLKAALENARGLQHAAEKHARKVDEELHQSEKERINAQGKLSELELKFKSRPMTTRLYNASKDALAIAGSIMVIGIAIIGGVVVVELVAFGIAWLFGFTAKGQLTDSETLETAAAVPEFTTVGVAV